MEGRNAEGVGGLRIAIVGTGISGLSSAWLLHTTHRVTVYEQAPRVGGHSNTVSVNTASGITPVDTGFIVYNEPTYPNLTALFAHLGVETQATEMSFAVSLANGSLEYAGTSLGTLFAQRRNLIRPRFLSMLWDLLRFYRSAPADAEALAESLMPLGAYLTQHGYGASFQRDHLLPMAAAVWSSTPAQMLDCPAAAFIRFCENHGLLRVTGRPIWRTVTGGSRRYVAKLTSGFSDRIRTGRGAVSIRRDEDGVSIRDSDGFEERFDRVILACHADQALAMLDDPTDQERRLLGAFGYSKNRAVLHSDASFMPKRKAVWSSWNYVTGDSVLENRACSVTYWMNRLQGLTTAQPLFVTLNPDREPAAGTLLHEDLYEHPLYDSAALQAQRRLAELQGQRHSWFCGAYFGAGFHEDGLRSGLEAAEAAGGVRRPWPVDDARHWAGAVGTIRPQNSAVAAS